MIRNINMSFLSTILVLLSLDSFARVEQAELMHNAQVIKKSDITHLNKGKSCTQIESEESLKVEDLAIDPAYFPALEGRR